MPRLSLRERLQYRLDNLMSRGPAALMVGLFGATLLFVVVVAVAVTLIGWGAESNFNFLDVLLRSFLTTIDSGTVANYVDGTTGPGMVGALLGITLFGIFLTSILIGILVTAIQGRLEELRKGHSTIVESGHTVILGWSSEIFTIISEIVGANANQRRSAIAVMAPRDKVEMEDEIRDRVGSTGRTRIVVRTGSPMDLADLARASIRTAKSIVVLPPDVEGSDVDVVKTILAITNGPDRRPQPYHIVAGLREQDSLAVGRIVGGAEAQLVLMGDLVARIVAQTCRQSGLSVVYQELLDFAGDEIYETDAPARLVGRTYREALFAYETSTVIGLLRGNGSAHLNPPMETAIQAGDRLLAISADDDTVIPAASQIGGAQDALIVAPVARPRTPERTLVLGWNRRGPAIAENLDAYVAPGSRMVIAATPDELASGPLAAGGGTNTVREIREANPTRRESLAALCAEGFDHVIILCSDVVPPDRSDARTLVTLINLRDIVAEAGYRFSITSEMLDVRNRALAEVTRADDFIVSDRLVSMLLSQLSENANLKAVFDDLFDPDGSEIYLRPAEDYVASGQEMTFITVLESAARRGETAIGFRQAAFASDAGRGYGVTVNPPKSAPVTFAPGDRVIVLAEGDD